MNERMLKPIYGLACIVGLTAACAGTVGPQLGTNGSASALAPQASELTASLFLVGDAGRARPGDPVLQAMTDLAAADPGRSTIVHLGDNLYPDGLDSVGSIHRIPDEIRLRTVATFAADAGVLTVLIPGNHDWDDFDVDGWRATIDQQQFIDGLGLETVTFLPKAGCPGPVSLDLGEDLRLVILDTAWWLYEGAKPGPGNSSCQNPTRSAVLQALDEQLVGAGSRRVVVAGHHPLNSGGPHGGYLGWQDHIFPLRRLAKWLWIPTPGVGSLYALARNLGVDRQDLGSSAYKAMADSLEHVFRRHDVVAYVGAHDHSLQVLTNGATRFSLVSGAGPSTGLTPTAWLPNSLFARSAWGFMRLDVHSDKKVRLTVFAQGEEGTVSEVFSHWLVAS